MRILMTGGGTAGHVSPTLAVASELKRLDRSVQIHYVGQYGDRFAKLTETDPAINQVHHIVAGKFRRYHGHSWREQILDVGTQLLNVRDFFLMVIGTLQALYLMLRWRPRAVFVKGGYVSVPVGVAAAITRRPIITHDSDAHPGLANRIVGRWALLHAVGMPPENYPYAKDRMVYTGVPINSSYKEVTKRAQNSAKRALKIEPEEKLILITGGSLGAEPINKIVGQILTSLLDEAQVIHVVGEHNVASAEQRAESTLKPAQKRRYRVLGFTTNMVELGAAADIIITRGGGTMVVEYAVQAKPIIMIPNPRLTEGHQVKNAMAYQNVGAAIVLDEAQLLADPQLLLEQVRKLLSDDSERLGYGQRIHEMVKGGAAGELAQLLLKAAKREPVVDDAAG